MTSPITLRAATPADVPFLLRLRKLTMTAHLQRAGVPTDDDTHHGRIRANFEDAKIICDGAESIGLLKLSRAPDEWHLHQIQILPAHQGKGIGNAVLRDVLADATRAGVPVSLSVLQGNPARRLYEQLGFRLVTETPIDATLTWR
ncbi:GCN5 family acetyltransferase [Burkholderia ubonensis]|uniref:GNAT family N-acetyltransferase n=1 Tax=Burkholderia ubonensis TaxID=101571 RepID=UPI0007546A55|nr:GNAT family N-acetyltransferase [Burkholderia ubonensis]KUZ75435.1 GCN5 family acetyltransferase [Burkholderia ubonensis]KVC74003.1 GCN5 family acetyltransferase [Burkholderia ubonensis]